MIMIRSKTFSVEGPFAIARNTAKQGGVFTKSELSKFWSTVNKKASLGERAGCYIFAVLLPNGKYHPVYVGSATKRFSAECLSGGQPRLYSGALKQHSNGEACFFFIVEESTRADKPNKAILDDIESYLITQLRVQNPDLINLRQIPHNWELPGVTGKKRGIGSEALRHLNWMLGLGKKPVVKKPVAKKPKKAKRAGVKRTDAMPASVSASASAAPKKKPGRPKKAVSAAVGTMASATRLKPGPKPKAAKAMEGPNAAVAAVTEPKGKGRGASVGAKSKYIGYRIAKVNTPKQKFRPGSVRYNTFSKFAQGMTFEEFKAKGGSSAGFSDAVREGLIEVSKA